jgi:hypothetical protein
LAERFSCTDNINLGRLRQETIKIVLSNFEEETLVVMATPPEFAIATMSFRQQLESVARPSWTQLLFELEADYVYPDRQFFSLGSTIEQSEASNPDCPSYQVGTLLRPWISAQNRFQKRSSHAHAFVDCGRDPRTWTTKVFPGKPDGYDDGGCYNQR